MNREKLISAGINYDEGVARFANNVNLYERILANFPQDPSYGNLISALQKEEFSEAFRHAHSLKGVSGNLSLEKLYNAICPLVDALRSNNTNSVNDFMPLVKESYLLAVDGLKNA